MITIIVITLIILFSIGCIFSIVEICRLRVSIWKTMENGQNSVSDAFRNSAFASEMKYGAISFLLGALYRQAGFDPGADVRCTVYVPDGSNLLQVTNYFPGNEEGGGRFFSTSKGILGEAFRSKSGMVEFLMEHQIDQNRIFTEELMRRWNYTEDEMKGLRQDRRAYLACPLLDDRGEVLAVFYADSAHGSAFAQPDVVERVLKFIPILTSYLKDCSQGHARKKRIRREYNEAAHVQKQLRTRPSSDELETAYTAHGWALSGRDIGSEVFIKDAHQLTTV